jgi:hypothetical protein
MKIYKIAQTFEMIPQDPRSPNDPNVQIQNLQNSQNALEFFASVTDAATSVMSALGNLEDALGMTGGELSNQFNEVIKAAAQQTPAFNLLAQMNLISSIDNLLDNNELNNIKSLIATNISSISDQYSTTQAAPQGGVAQQLITQI